MSSPSGKSVISSKMSSSPRPSIGAPLFLISYPPSMEPSFETGWIISAPTEKPEKKVQPIIQEATPTESFS